ncbi:MAG TPA: hypothetical protein VE981_00705 [Planctomycetota bacterium]|nr:hypothetical protein [Planctomycetota bacterium]
MTDDDDLSTPIPLSSRRDEKAAVIIGSLVLLIVDVVVFAAIAVHTMLSRRRYGRFIEDMELTDLSLPVQFFMTTPGPIYAAGFLLVVVALILKECAIDRKAVALKINLFALAAAVCLFITFLWTVQFHFDAMLPG